MLGGQLARGTVRLNEDYIDQLSRFELFLQEGQ